MVEENASIIKVRFSFYLGFESLKKYMCRHSAYWVKPSGTLSVSAYLLCQVECGVCNDLEGHVR